MMTDKDSPAQAATYATDMLALSKAATLYEGAHPGTVPVFNNFNLTLFDFELAIVEPPQVCDFLDKANGTGAFSHDGVYFPDPLWYWFGSVQYYMLTSNGILLLLSIAVARLAFRARRAALAHLAYSNQPLAYQSMP